MKEAPGIESAAITDALPLGRNRTWGAGAVGVTYERGKYPLAFVRVVSEGYPAAMGVPLLAGRDLAASDMADKEPVMLVNKTLADALWPGAGSDRQVRAGRVREGGRRVVGVVGDVRHLSLEQASGNEMYIPARQCDDLAGAYLVVRSTLPPGQLAGTLRAALGPVTGTLASNDFRTLQQLVDKSVSPRRFTVLLLGGFAVFALVLASLGIYALISYSVNQRTQEIGIRMALGASARDVQARIVGQTLRLAAIGMVIGAACSWLLVRGAAEPAVRRDAARSADVPRDGRRPDDGGARRRLPARAPRLAHRSDGGAPRRVSFDSLNRPDYAGIAYKDASGPRKG